MERGMMTAEELPALSPRRDWMKQHLKALFSRVAQEEPGLMFEIRAIHPTIKSADKSLVNADHFPLTEDGFNDGLDWAEKLNREEGFNVYVGVNPRRHDAPRGRAAAAADVYPLHFWQFADADSERSVNALRQNVRAPHRMMVATGLQPTMRVHCYWELEEPTRNSQAWTDVQRHLQRAFDGDAVHDLPRILRLAGSISYPSEKKAAKGYRTEIVQIAFYPSRGMVDGSDILSIPAEHPATHAEPQSGAPLNLATPGVNAPACVDAIRGGVDLHNNTRDLIAHLVGTGRSDWEIQTMAGELLRGRSDGGTLAEIPELIAGARQKFNRPDPVLSEIVMPALEASGPKGASAYLATPPIRQWIVNHWIVQGAVNSLYGDGGIGKTLLAQQIGLCVATGSPFLAMAVNQVPVLAVLCEDDEAEVWRRQHAMINAMKLGYHPKLDDLQLWSRVGAENFLLTYAGGRPLLTPFYSAVLQHLQAMGEGPKLLILDTLADTFGGNEIERTAANYFIKTTLGSIALGTNSTILLLAHPSRAGLDSGDMLSGSTAWHNAVRSRMALQWLKGDDGKPDPDMSDKRLLTRPKANYAKANAEILIEYKEGAFIAASDTVKGSVEWMGKSQVIKEELARMAQRGTPLSPHNKASRSVRRHRFMYHGDRIMPAEAVSMVEEMLDNNTFQHCQKKGLPWGIYPTETTR